MEYEINSPFLEDLVAALRGSECPKLAAVQALIEDDIEFLESRIRYIRTHHARDTYFALVRSKLEKERTVFERLKAMINDRKTVLGCEVG